MTNDFISYSPRIPVSVVIPCYRCSNTIERALNSVAGQSALPEQVILVEDKSGDDTLDKLQQLRDLYPLGWINIIAKPTNSGPGETRNIGWEAATSPYVAFLDADDSWHPRKLELQYKLMAENPTLALTGHDGRYLDARDHPPVSDFSPTLFQEYISFISARRLLLFNEFTTTSVVMLRRDLPQRFEAHKKYCEDYLLWMQIVFSGYQACMLKLPLSYAYKAAYGEGGLTRHIWRMEMGELDAYKKIFCSHRIGIGTALPIYLFSLVKCARRYVISWLR